MSCQTDGLIFLVISQSFKDFESLRRDFHNFNDLFKELEARRFDVRGPTKFQGFGIPMV